MIDNNLNARSQVTSNIQGFVNKAQVCICLQKMQSTDITISLTIWLVQKNKLIQYVINDIMIINKDATSDYNS